MLIPNIDETSNIETIKTNTKNKRKVKELYLIPYVSVLYICLLPFEEDFAAFLLFAIY